MKVPGSVREVHQQCREGCEPLKSRVDDFVNGRKKPKWHYESRLKELVNFALKLETGRVVDPLALEDFFACTLVVENYRAVDEARTFVHEYFDVQYTRPEKANRTSKKPSDFPFDDLRMYVRWREDPAAPSVSFTHITFEFQIKTFLQHAWGIATHDLVYKSDRASWPLQRVAYQIKAMLEHAEASILGAQDLANTEALRFETREFESLQYVIDFLEAQWSSDALPDDRVRLGRNILALQERFKIPLSLVQSALAEDTRLGRGTNLLNLSPYGIIVQALLTQNPEIFQSLGNGDPRKFRLFLPREIVGSDALVRQAPTEVVVP
jgi:Region found in RelA / SpoT proteins